MTSPRRTPPLILVVEDYDDAREMYVEYLTFTGFRVESATNGLEAIEMTQRLVPDLVLMDLALPKLDGWEATRRLKSDAATSHIPVIALTGHALAGHAERAREAGCDSFITKPCVPDELVAEISRVLGISSPAGTQAAPPHAKTGPAPDSSSRPAPPRRGRR
ncbi:MAG: response regulator [Acidobacteriota bacterium]|nr:response regulator [Acidobacteriota bacterium]